MKKSEQDKKLINIRKKCNEYVHTIAMEGHIDMCFHNDNDTNTCDYKYCPYFNKGVRKIELQNSDNPLSNVMTYQDVTNIELCEDCISRQALLNELGDINMDIYTNEVKEIVNKLPPVISTRDKGKVDVLGKIIDEIVQAHCSVETDYDLGRNYGLYMALQIIFKYTESEVNTNEVVD